MWKFLFYTLLSYDRLDSRLAEMEAAGYRVDRVVLNHFFRFTKSAPKNTSYYLTYLFPKEWGLGEQQYELQRNYNANDIKCSFSSVELLRICVPFAEKAQYAAARRAYFIHVIKNQMVIIGFFCALLLLAIHVNHQETPQFATDCCAAGAILLLLCLAWKLSQLIRLKRQGKGTITR